jgi:hypothetical protein
MKIQNPDHFEEKITNLTKENAKLKKVNLWLTVFVILFFIIQVYNLVVKWFL